jgi:hypothetical protein
MKTDYESYFNYRWRSDKNMCIYDEVGQGLLNQLPGEVQFGIVKDFLYSDFLFKFKNFFVFPRFDVEGKFRPVWGPKGQVYTKVQKTRFTFDDPEYREFICQLCTGLEPRREARNSMLYNENESAYEVLFFETGAYYIGFELNHEHYWVLK